MLTGTLFFAVEFNTQNENELESLSDKIQKTVKGLSDDIVSCEECSDISEDNGSGE